MKDMTILEFENQMTHFDVAYEQACIEHDLNLRRIHNKMVLENAIMEEATELYLAEAEETSGKKKNIFVRMIEAIQKFVRNLISKITGKPLEEAPKEDIKLEQNPKTLMQRGKDLAKQITQCLTGHKGVVAGVAAGAAVATAAGNFILKASTAGDTIRSIREYMGTVDDDLNRFKEQIEEGEKAGKNMDEAKKYVKEYSGIMSRLGTVVSCILGTNTDPNYQNIRDKHASDVGGMTRDQIAETLNNLKQKRRALSSQNGIVKSAIRGISNFGNNSNYSKAYNAAGRAQVKHEIDKLDKEIKKYEGMLKDSGRKAGKYNAVHYGAY
nr:MAG TPA: hypothetical protein [Caudoviricetes sp.]